MAFVSGPLAYADSNLCGRKYTVTIEWQEGTANKVDAQSLQQPSQ
jgi:hypothetical protein